MLVLVPLALAGSIADLAASTVLLLLLVFIVVNGSLFVLKRRSGEVPGQFEIPAVLPFLGMLVCAILLLTRLASSDWAAPALAGGIVLASALIYAVFKPKAVAVS